MYTKHFSVIASFYGSTTKTAPNAMKHDFLGPSDCYLIMGKINSHCLLEFCKSSPLSLNLLALAQVKRNTSFDPI